MQFEAVPDKILFMSEASIGRNEYASGRIQTAESSPNNKSAFDRQLLAEVFPPDKAEGAYILGIIAIHGNEPQIMTAAIGAEINQILAENNLPGASIVLPSIYGDRTRQILLEDFPTLADTIYLSDGLGEILKKTEFSRAGYQAHMREVAAHQPRVYEEALDYLSRPFVANSLAGNPKEFSPEGKRLEINAGANITVSLPGEKKTHFIFPVLLSEMMERTLTDPEISRHFNHATLERVIRLAKDFEATYRTTQIPYVHTLYGQENYDATGKILTPPLKKRQTPPEIELKNGNAVYIMVSGSEIGREVVEDQAKQVEQHGHEIVFPPWLKLNFGKPVHPNAVFDKRVGAVMGRIGWGIGWLSQVAEKPFIAMPHLFFDNPEMHFNLQTLQRSGLGMIWEDRQDLVDEALKLQPAIRDLNQRINTELKVPDGMDGIRFAAENIVEAEIREAAEHNKNYN